MAIEARFFYDPSLDEWALYLIDPVGHGDQRRRILESDGKGGLISRPMHADTPNQPVLRWPHEPLWQAIGAALAEHGCTPKPPPDTETPALKAHLSDALAVRDRLLSLVERKV